MKRVLFVLLPALLGLPVQAIAGPDTYVCDSAIFGGETASVKPNVLLVFDTSGSMNDTVPIEVCSDSETGSYDPATDYTFGVNERYCGSSWSAETCSRNTVYECSASNWVDGACSRWNKIDVSLDAVPCSGIKTALQTAGKWGAGKTRIERSSWGSSGYFCNSTSSSYVYATGNWIVWQKKGGSSRCTTRSEKKIDVAKTVLIDLISHTTGVNFGLMVFNFKDESGRGGTDGGRFAERVVSGKKYIADVKDMSAYHTGTVTNRQALMEVVYNMTPEGWTPLAETLLEAMRYYKGDNTAFNATTYTDSFATPYTSPIMASCQPNYVVLISDGMSTQDDSPVLQTICTDVPKRKGDCDNDGKETDSYGNIRRYTDNGTDFLDDVAQYLYDTDFSPTRNGKQNVRTYTVGFGLGGGDAQAVQLLQETALNGRGEAFLASDTKGLTVALTTILAEILDANSSFVAPVVPKSPDNRTYSGNRIYLGLLKPVTGKDWLGNLKKFGLDAAGKVLDRNGFPALDANGRILDTALSYWSGAVDGRAVDQGGIGGKLSERAGPRKMFTFLGNRVLTDDSNNFDTFNSELLTKIGGLSTTAERIVKYVRGMDAYDEDNDKDTGEVRPWILGDILHSQPLIVNYGRYPLLSEGDPAVNTSILYAGSNDGQLHAFRDADGEELWSFVPPSVLPNLKYLGNGIHNYFMDSSPTVYMYDKKKDGIVNAAEGDKVLLLVGMRRGGGIDTLPATGSRGSYYAIDVTDPLNPTYLWELNSMTAGFGELGETWSDPVFGRLRVGGVDRIVAIFGAGYDNNDDLRFGNTQKFPDTTTASTVTTGRTGDAGGVTSPGNSSQVNPRGRGIYVLELATVDSRNVPTFHTTPVQLWKYVYDPARDALHNPTYAFPTAVAAVDSDFDGYLDLLYAGDTGGNMWRFRVGNRTSTENWSAAKIFSANPSDVTVSRENPVTNGRRILYPPAVVLEHGYVGLYFGSGDRAHPLNRGVVDRLYALYDRQEMDRTKSQPSPLGEAHMVNVTENLLQIANPAPRPATCTEEDTSPKCILERLYSPERYGWFIRLDEAGYAGEKVLASPIVFNRVAYFTTFTPNVPTRDPCAQGNLGTARVYALNYKTGEAVFNFDLSNDTETNSNDRAKSDGGVFLRRSDRVKTVGGGIASGVGIRINKDGSSSGFGGAGGALFYPPTPPGGTIKPMYWMVK